MLPDTPARHPARLGREGRSSGWQSVWLSETGSKTICTKIPRYKCANTPVRGYTTSKDKAFLKAIVVFT